MSPQHLINEFNAFINTLSGGNQIMSGAIVLWLLGVGSYLAKSMPNKVFSFLKKHLTTELSVNNGDLIFYRLNAWIEEQSFSKNVRRIKLNNGMYGTEETNKTIGYGTHLVWYGWKPIKISYNKEESAASTKFKESITIVKLGRSHDLFNKLIEELASREKEEARSLYVYNGDYWRRKPKSPRRDLSTVSIPDEQKNNLIETLDKFVSSEDWYVEKAIPYQLGILLHGPPGTGKTSLIKAIGDYLNKNVAICPSNGVYKLDDVVSTLPDDSILVLEDIDSSESTHNRDLKPASKDLGLSDEDLADLEDAGVQMKTGNSLSNVLNAIDGIVSIHGRILIMTTNHKEVLDPALIRPGRIDLDLEIGYMNEETFIGFLDRFYDDVPRDITLSDNTISGAKLQNDVLQSSTLEEVLGKYTNEY